MFPEDDEHDTYYIADFNSKNTKIAELCVDYPYCYGHIDASGNLWLVNTLRDTVTFVHLSGSFHTYLANGDINVAAARNMNYFAAGDFNLRAGGIVNIDGTNVYINSGRAMPLTVTPRTKPTSNNPVANDY